MTLHEQVKEMMKEGILVMQNYAELEEVIGLLKSKSVRTFVELGSAYGGSLYLYGLQCVPHRSLIISVDPKPRSTLQLAAEKLRKAGHDVRLIHAKAEKAFAEVKKMLGAGKIDLLHMDADGTVERTMEEHRLYSPMIGKDGILLLHDINSHSHSAGVAWRRLKERSTEPGSMFEIALNGVLCMSPWKKGVIGYGVMAKTANAGMQFKHLNPLTVAVLCYGDYHDMHIRCLDSLRVYCRFDCVDVLIGMNEVCQATKDWVRNELAPFMKVRVIDSPENIFKPGMFRKMFPAIETKWHVWLDDDAYITDHSFLPELERAIDLAPDTVVMFGRKRRRHMDEKRQAWAKASDWWKGVVWWDAQATERNCDIIGGGVRCVRMDVIHKLGWPDDRMVQSRDCDDLMFYGAIRQMGYEASNFRIGYHFPKDVGRRGPCLQKIAE